MSAPAADFTDGQKRVLKESGRRRTFGYFFGLSLVVFLDVAIMEGDMLTHALDDTVIVIISAIVVILILMSWKDLSIARLRRTNNILTIISVIFLVMVIVAFVYEANDPDDIGDDFPKIFIAAALLLNRFL